MLPSTSRYRLLDANQVLEVEEEQLLLPINQHQPAVLAEPSMLSSRAKERSSGYAVFRGILLQQLINLLTGLMRGLEHTQYCW